MEPSCTPKSASRPSSRASKSTDCVPTTPQLPFDLPRRRSSLAFSKLISTPSSDENSHTPPDVGAESETKSVLHSSNIGRKRAVETPVNSVVAPSGHEVQVQKVLQIARANLQLDMHFASSPVGSIDSRLPRCYPEDQNENHVWPSLASQTKQWRYSTLPSLFSGMGSDVREPLPAASPILPTGPSLRPNDSLTQVEPMSSGFASPVSPDHADGTDLAPDFPPRPYSTRSSSSISENRTTSTTKTDAFDNSGLAQPMTGLRVCSDLETAYECQSDRMDDSPIADHVRRKLGNDQGRSEYLPPLPDSIILSQSAKAAAESALAKRGILNRMTVCQKGKGETEQGLPRSRAALSHARQTAFPDPGLRRYLTTAPCPDPFLHVRMSDVRTNSNQINDVKVQSVLHKDGMMVADTTSESENASRIPGHWITANGSPMPLTGRAAPLSSNMSHTVPVQPYSTSSSPLQVSYSLPMYGQPLQAQHLQSPNQFSKSGWHCKDGPSNGQNPMRANVYSFSTAAAKMIGDSAAPDSRIRDSYRTDTLTMLARPPSRFRKNGIAANPPLLRPGREHDRMPQLQHSYRYPRPAPKGVKKQTRLPNMPFRSSPPRPSAYYGLRDASRKRSKDDSYLSDVDVAEDDTASSIKSTEQTQYSSEANGTDPDLRTAVRKSLFGPSTPECLQGEREGVRELSPNIDIWRKGMAGDPRRRKKRRPSYWDGDLEEVRMSPAGVGGIASSPAISKRSMVADLENTSSQTCSVLTIENEAIMNDNVYVDAGSIHDTNEVEMRETGFVGE